MSTDYVIDLMDLYTGATLTMRWDHGHGDTPTDRDHSVWFNWTEGNWACDCNRWREWLVQTQGDYDDEQESEGCICGEPRIRARCRNSLEPFNDFPLTEELRVGMAKQLQEQRAALKAKWKAESSNENPPV